MSIPSSSEQGSSTASTLAFRLQPDGRQVLTRKRARELLASLSTAPYTSISLGGCALGDAAAGVAGPALVALANKQCVRSVTLADCIASLPQDEALRSLSALASSIGMWKGLCSVDLSYNALGSKGIAACAALLQGQRRLRELHLIESGLAAESARLLQRYLCPGQTTQLRVLQVHANRLESQGVGYLSSVIERSPQLERLRMSSLGAASPALGTLANALKGKKAIRDLDLSDNFLDAPVAAELASVLITLPLLERLLLRDLDMGDEAVEALICPLTKADPLPPLAELGLAGNELTNHSAESIGEAFVAFQSSLVVLELSRNDLGAAGVDTLAEFLGKAKEAPEPPVLTHLLLAENCVPALSAVRISFQLMAFPALECLDFSGNVVFEDVADRLGTALGSSVVLYDGTSQEDETVEGPDGQVTGEEDGNTLRAALQDLANAPSVAPRVERQTTRVEEPTSTSSQSKSTVSRLRSIFSRGSENSNTDGVTSRPVSHVEATTVATSIDGNRVSFEDESGIIPDDENIVTPEALRTRTGRTIGTISTSTADNRDLQERSPHTPGGSFKAFNGDVMQSARKLKESIASLSKEISDVAGELQIPMTSPAMMRGGMTGRESAVGQMEGNVNDYLLVGDAGRANAKKSTLTILVDVFGGLLVAVFVIILVLAIAQSQEESTFSYSLV